MTLIVGGDLGFESRIVVFQSWNLSTVNQIVFYPNYKLPLIYKYSDSFINNSVLLVTDLASHNLLVDPSQSSKTERVIKKS